MFLSSFERLVRTSDLGFYALIWPYPLQLLHDTNLEFVMCLVISGYVGLNICEIVSFWMKSRENRTKVITAANQRKEKYWEKADRNCAWEPATCPKARENAGDQLAFHWLKRWCDLFRQITKGIKKTKVIVEYFELLNENYLNSLVNSWSIPTKKTRSNRRQRGDKERFFPFSPLIPGKVNIPMITLTAWKHVT